jgi:hypothetical protein
MQIGRPLEEELRSSDDIAQRTMALACVYGLSINVPRNELINWLDREAIRSALSPAEADLFEMVALTEQQLIDISWRSEAIVMLLWSVGFIPKLPPENEESDPESFLNLIPPYTADMSSDWFFAACHARPSSELLGMADIVAQLHWQVREAQLKGVLCPAHINPGVIKERHHAINWITGYGGLGWDDVTTDT